MANKTQKHSSCDTFLLVLSLWLNSWQNVQDPPLETGAVQLRHGLHRMLREHEGDSGKALGTTAVFADGERDICDLP